MTNQPTPSETPGVSKLPPPNAAPEDPSVLNTDISRTLYRGLLRKDAESKQPAGPKLASMYLGAKIARRTDNPENLVQSAHSIRLLIEGLPLHYPDEVPLFVGHKDLRERARELQEVWENYRAGRSSEKELLQAMEKFGRANEEVGVTRRQQAEALINAMDPAGRGIPPELVELQIRRWMVHHKFFVGVAKHDSTSADQFDRELQAFETFLVDRLGLRSLDTQNALGKLISEGEGRG